MSFRVRRPFAMLVCGRGNMAFPILFGLVVAVVFALEEWGVAATPERQWWEAAPPLACLVLWYVASWDRIEVDREFLTFYGRWYRRKRIQLSEIEDGYFFENAPIVSSGYRVCVVVASGVTKRYRNRGDR